MDHCENTAYYCPGCGRRLEITPQILSGDAPCGDCERVLWFVRKTVGEATVLAFLPGLMTASEGLGRADEVIASVGDCPRVVLDLSQLRIVSSVFLSMLLTVQKHVTGCGGSVKLCGLNPLIDDIFQSTKLNMLFAIHPDQHAALGAFA